MNKTVMLYCVEDAMKMTKITTMTTIWTSCYYLQFEVSKLNYKIFGKTYYFVIIIEWRRSFHKCLCTINKIKIQV